VPATPRRSKRPAERSGAAHAGGELARDEQRDAGLLGDRLDARRLVHRRADDVEGEPVGRADVGVGHGAQVQPEAELDRRLAGAPALVVDHRELREGVDRRVERGLAHRGLVLRAADLEHDQDGVADELQDLAAARRDGVGAVLEVVVEER